MTHDDDPFDQGLAHDLDTLRHQQVRHRRAVLGLLGAGGLGLGAGVLGLAGARGGALGPAGAAAAAATCGDPIPSETAGPYPGDGSNGPDVLLLDGVTRRDIRRSIGGASGVAAGVPFWFGMQLIDADTCRPLRGHAVYAWHCDRNGDYSMYSSGLEEENYLRGVQVSNRRGKLVFRSIFPGWYSGRWPHVHFEVYRNRATALRSGTILHTSQLAIPRRPCAQVYQNAAGYEDSWTNLNRISLSSDMVFGDDGGVDQLATVTGNVTDGYRAALTVRI
ncbi:3,4-dioxygenase subunit beta [Nocardioides sp.]|uniref:dioxygenase family protein n=1 Tax=Nocardioides sp. TaxID=35761 RepID=UPI0035124035